MDFFASIPLLLGILYIKVYFLPSLRHFYLFFLQESVCSGPILLSWGLDRGCESSSHGTWVSFHQSWIFPELQFREFLSRSLFKFIHLSSAFSILLLSLPRDVFTSDVVILWCRICFVPFPKFFFSILSPICSFCLSFFSYKFLSIFTMVVKIKLLFASSISGPSKPSCWFSSLVCKPHVTFYVLWFFIVCGRALRYKRVSCFNSCRRFVCSRRHELFSVPAG